jgi:hypothetical protein
MAHRFYLEVFNEDELTLILLALLGFDKDVIRNCETIDKKILNEEEMIGDIFEDLQWWVGNGQSLVKIYHSVKGHTFYLMMPILTGDSTNTLENIKNFDDHNAFEGNCSVCGNKVYDCYSVRENISECICQPQYDEKKCIGFSCFNDKEYIKQNFKSIIETMSSMSTINCRNIVKTNLHLSWLWYRIFGEFSTNQF